MRILDALETNPLFRGFSREQIAALIGPDAAVSEYARGDVIFSPRSFARALGFLITGSALVYKVSSDGRRVLMSRLTPGATFGMATLFTEREPFPTEIHAERACRVLFLPKDWVQAALSTEPRLSSNYISLLSERIHFLNRRIEGLTGDDLSTRLLYVLRSFEGSTADGTFTLPYSLSQLAEILGVGRASLYRALDALTDAGVLTHEGRIFKLLGPTQMEEMS